MLLQKDKLTYIIAAESSVNFARGEWTLGVGAVRMYFNSKFQTEQKEFTVKIFAIIWPPVVPAMSHKLLESK